MTTLTTVQVKLLVVRNSKLVLHTDCGFNIKSEPAVCSLMPVSGLEIGKEITTTNIPTLELYPRLGWCVLSGGVPLGPSSNRSVLCGSPITTLVMIWTGTLFPPFWLLR